MDQRGIKRRLMTSEAGPPDKPQTEQWADLLYGVAESKHDVEKTQGLRPLFLLPDSSPNTNSLNDIGPHHPCVQSEEMPPNSSCARERMQWIKRSSLKEPKALPQQCDDSSAAPCRRSIATAEELPGGNSPGSNVPHGCRGGGRISLQFLHIYHLRDILQSWFSQSTYSYLNREERGILIAATDHKFQPYTNE